MGREPDSKALYKKEINFYQERASEHRVQKIAKVLFNFHSGGLIIQPWKLCVQDVKGRQLAPEQIIGGGESKASYQVYTVF